MELQKVDNIRVTHQGIVLDLMISNPYPLTITLSRFAMDVSVDRYKFNDIVYEPEIKLKPFSKKYYTVTVDLHPLEHIRTSTGALLAMLSQDSTKLILEGRTRAKILFLHTNVNFHKELYFKYRRK